MDGSKLRDILADRIFPSAIVVVAVGTLLFLTAPTLIIMVASLTSSSYLVFPPPGLSFRWYHALWQTAEVWDAAYRSIIVAALATLISIGLGVPAAFPLARGGSRFREGMNALFMSPLILPSLVVGLAMLLFVNLLGLKLSLPLLVLAHVVITLPYVVRTTAASLALLSEDIEQAARSLGADRLRTFFYVTLPFLFPGILAGAALAFITSFDNLTVSLFMASARFEVLPIRLWALIENDIDIRAAAIATVLILTTVILVLLIERVAGLTRLVKSGS
jgi:putative spermidine/putrescine transport system permease protein